MHDENAYPAPWNQLDALARAHAERGNHESAIQLYKKSLIANPKNELAKRRLREMGADPDQKSN
jgi:tetratricopeptide (TPR) repeat protein